MGKSTPRARLMHKLTTSQCIDELRGQAAGALSNNFTEVMEANAAAYISDGIVNLENKMALRSAAAPLEDVPDDQKDWHPGSDGKVLDLVHPSLFPLMYGTSKYLRAGTVPLPDCASCTGQGKTVPIPTLSIDYFDYSTKHQWLPCEVFLSASGEAKITSYINNLHPDGNEALYAAIEQVISNAIPLCKAAVRSTLYRYERPRLVVEGDGYDHEAAGLIEEKRRKRWQERSEVQGDTTVSHYDNGNAREAAQGTDPDNNADDTSDEDEDENEDEYVEECYKSKYIKVPEPDPYEPRVRTATDEDATGFEKTFAGRNLQVIVKLANIHLTPEKPNYDGGSWHIEVRVTRTIMSFGTKLMHFPGFTQRAHLCQCSLLLR